LPIYLPSLDGNFPTREGCEAAGIQFMFRRMNALVQGFWRVSIEHRHSGLADDGARIHPGIHKMHRAARHFYAVVKRLFPRMQTGKTRQ